MTKTKKIIIGALAAGLIATATCIAASASTERASYQINEGYGAVFSWGNGEASMKNLKDKTRYASVSITSYNNTTGDYAGFKSSTGDIGYGKTVSVDAEKRSPTYNFRCSGTIHTAGTQYSPTDWEVIDKEYPQ